MASVASIDPPTRAGGSEPQPAPETHDSEHFDLEDDTVPRSGSGLYTKKAYWDARFKKEEGKDWLCRFAHVRERVRALVSPAARVLLVGCGNSTLAADMAADGYTSIVSSDYSAVVIDRMRAKVGDAGGAIDWQVLDMMSLAVPDASFDAYIDKAAMDAILADGGDTWSPPAELLAISDKIMGEAARVLRPGGAYLQVTFAQPHFRRKYLEHAPVAGLWAGPAQRFDVDVGLGYFLYVLTRKAEAEADAPAEADADAGEGGSGAATDAAAAAGGAGSA